LEIGSAAARFEPSDDPEYADRRVVHMRFVKILEPVTCTVNIDKYNGRFIRPVEGELFTVRNAGGPPKPWAYDIDEGGKSKLAAGLRALWDISTSS
jgi:hypothetical protein